MKQQVISEIVQGMLPYLDNEQLEALMRVLDKTFSSRTITEERMVKEKDQGNGNLIEQFIAAKRIEGCSEKTLDYYRKTIETMLKNVDKGIKQVQTDDLRAYLMEYQATKKSSKVTIDNIPNTIHSRSIKSISLRFSKTISPTRIPVEASISIIARSRISME